MQVKSWQTIEVEVETDISISDIADAIIESTDIKTRNAMFRAITNFHNFMKAVPDSAIAECNEEQKKIIIDYLKKQLARFETTGGDQ